MINPNLASGLILSDIFKIIYIRLHYPSRPIETGRDPSRSIEKSELKEQPNERNHTSI